MASALLPRNFAVATYTTGPGVYAYLDAQGHTSLADNEAVTGGTATVKNLGPVTVYVDSKYWRPPGSAEVPYQPSLGYPIAVGDTVILPCLPRTGQGGVAPYNAVPAFCSEQEATVRVAFTVEVGVVA